jgi:hypothetical protein
VPREGGGEPLGGGAATFIALLKRHIDDVSELIQRESV